MLEQKQKQNHCLQPPARPHILRIVELRPSGIVALEGSDAARAQRQIKDVAHSTLPILDPALHPERFYRGPTLHCRVCGGKAKGPKMVLCDTCNQGYHVWCLDKPLARVPDDARRCSLHSSTFGLTTSVANTMPFLSEVHHK